jgi:hypothetical protein
MNQRLIIFWFQAHYSIWIVHKKNLKRLYYPLKQGYILLA